ncbi:DUF2163 domain-containing protein [Jiella sp. MQZ9-1]|uniref:DUF2163 domain-containing protein n=1 Tax=Jiella flava TaxID=2816857 RepID=A0A939FX86_9HYPH|nr:DUF2163 domain-containing protein [Jiella flava]MBO0661840.1 DUF2163 domain-containing protein [Jiella flava]MCD2470480.1 DUF2163 domain-containing protein [Jiella flava]
MRALPPGLAAATEHAVTTLATCWRLTRSDGVVLGFTDHDAAITFDGTRFEAASGLGASETETALGLEATTAEVQGALSSARIDEADIAAGRFDGATIETFVVDWRNPDAHVRIDVADLGEVRRGDVAFTAELRSVAARLEAVRGRLYRRRCDAVFGDQRCRFEVTSAPYTASAAVSDMGRGWVETTATLGVTPEHYAFGRLTLLTGAASGLATDLLAASACATGAVRFALSGQIAAPIAIGDRFAVVQGCDKRFATCRDRFGNAANFRGFPHIPGADAGFAVAKKGDRLDGSPVVP